MMLSPDLPDGEGDDGDSAGMSHPSVRFAIIGGMPSNKSVCRCRHRPLDHDRLLHRARFCAAAKPAGKNMQ
jgi:hypothetical protein